LRGFNRRLPDVNPIAINANARNVDVRYNGSAGTFHLGSTSVKGNDAMPLNAYMMGIYMTAGLWNQLRLVKHGMLCSD
jgi:hypothetical protein